MKLSNRHGLPDTVVNLAKRDTYTRGAAKISVTELIGSPRIRILRNRHRDEIIVDVADQFWSLMGRAIHSVVEQGADKNHIAEERLFAEVNGWPISGGIDLQVVHRINDDEVESEVGDFKFTSAWAVMNPKADWERQTNCYAWLTERNKGWRVKRLFINAIVRDWSRHEAERNPAYPQAPMVVLNQRLWSPEEREAYIRERVLIHQDAERRAEWGEDLPECSDEERWFNPGKLAVVKDGRVRALKLFDANEREAAEAYAAENKARVEARPGENKRCEQHCQVRDWCEQYAKIKEEGMRGE